MTHKDNEVSEQKNYAKPQLLNYGDLSDLTMANRDATGAKDGVSGNATKTGPVLDAVDQTFERIDGSSDYSRRGGSGSDGGGRGG